MRTKNSSSPAHTAGLNARLTRLLIAPTLSAIRDRPGFDEAMTILPIVDATLRQASRKRWTYWSRVVGVGVAACVAVPLILAIQRAGGFLSLGAIMAGFSPFLMLILLNIGATSTYDCISEEKREGTLGLLFLTDLKGMDVALGKLVGACTQIFISWLAMLPLAAMLVLVGGFTWQDVLRIMLGIGNGLFCGAAAGLLGSAYCRERKHAVGLTMAWLLFTCILPPVTAGLLVAFADFRQPPAWLMAIGPGPAFWGTFVSIGGIMAPDVWKQLAVSHGVAWIAIVLACWFTPRRWQERQLKQVAPVVPTPTPPPALPDPSESSIPPTPDSRKTSALQPPDPLDFNQAKRELLNETPFAWLLSRYRWSPLTPWLILVAGGVIAAIILDLVNPRSFDQVAIVAVWICFLMQAGLKAKIGEQASAGIYEEKRSGALEHLLVTLLRPREIIAAHWKTLRNSYGPPLTLLLVVELLFALGCFLQLVSGGIPNHRIEEYGYLLFCWLYLPVTLFIDTYALTWVGMWVALRAKKKWSHVRGNAFAYVVLMPTGIFIVIWISLMWFSNGRAGSFPLFLIIWGSISVGNHLLWLRICKPVLRRRFRKIAQETATPVRLA